MQITDILKSAPLILTECAIAERLRRSPDIHLHPTLFNTPLIYDADGKARMTEIYRQYRQIALKAGLPMLLCAPTWRIDRRRLAEAGVKTPLNLDAVLYMRKLQSTWQDDTSPLFIGGLIGPKNDCYSPSQALSAEEAEHYHSWQIAELTNAGVDIIIAQTLPAVSEATGMAKALARTDIPALISFVINRQAQVLDGTPLPAAIQQIDGLVSARPAGYMVNCVYPTFIQAEKQSPELFNRLIGIQANSSAKDHSRLDGATSLQREPLNHWGEDMLRLNRDFGMKILGGCCGTDDTYLQYLVDNSTRKP